MGKYLSDRFLSQYKGIPCPEEVKKKISKSVKETKNKGKETNNE